MKHFLIFIFLLFCSNIKCQNVTAYARLDSINGVDEGNYSISIEDAPIFKTLQYSIETMKLENFEKYILLIDEGIYNATAIVIDKNFNLIATSKPVYIVGNDENDYFIQTRNCSIVMDSIIFTNYSNINTIFSLTESQNISFENCLFQKNQISTSIFSILNSNEINFNNCSFLENKSQLSSIISIISSQNIHFQDISFFHNTIQNGAISTIDSQFISMSDSNFSSNYG